MVSFVRKPVLSHANNKGTDQPVHLSSLISAFVILLHAALCPLSICGQIMFEWKSYRDGV